MKILITGACGVTSRAVARSLRKSTLYSKAEFIGTDICENTYGLHEGLYEKIYKVPESTEDGYENIIRTIYAEEKIDAVIVIPEPEVCTWAESLDDLTVLTPPPKFCRITINKAKVFDMLSPANLVPANIVCDRDYLVSGSSVHNLRYPVWMRNAASGTTSGIGSYLVKSPNEERLWAELHANTARFQLAEYLPGRNLACSMLFHEGRLVYAVCAERIKYFMAHLVPSGVSGNTCEGRVFIEDSIIAKSEKAVRIIADSTKEIMRGLVTVDLKEDQGEEAYITEINLRHVAFTSAFADAGFNISEAQLLATYGKIDEIEVCHCRKVSGDNRFYRDIDGLPLYIENQITLSMGASVDCNSVKG
jgi:hypothetical protein